MARWILFRDVGATRVSCEVARCVATDWESAVARLAPFALGRERISLGPRTPPTKERPFYVQSVVSAAEDAPARRLLARRFLSPYRRTSE